MDVPESAFAGLFAGCTSLTNYCYQQMFIDGYNPHGSSLAATMVTENLLEIYCAGLNTSDDRTFAQVLKNEKSL